MTLTIAHPSRLPIVQQSSEAVLGQQSSSQPHELLGVTHAHAITTTTTTNATQTPLSCDVVVRLPEAGGWTRFLCCVSSQDTAHPA